MEAGGIPPAGSARALRLDPFALPVRYPAKDSGADGQVRQVELHRERVVLRRAVRGMRMSVGVPVSAFRGVALRLVPADGVEPAAVTVMLDHTDHALSVPLYAASDSDDVTAIWKAWGRVLGLPLLVAENDGALREPFARLGGLAIDDPQPRRRRRSVLKRRRPSILLRRKPGRRVDGARVHRGEHEIIARN
jgi:hypothetical protein